MSGEKVKRKTGNEQVVFRRGIEACSECSGAVKVIACNEDPVFIKKILTRLYEKARYAENPFARKLGTDDLFVLGLDEDGVVHE